MIWNIYFKVYEKGKLVYKGFETSTAHDLNHALQEVETCLDLEDSDKLELQINTIKL